MFSIFSNGKILQCVVYFYRLIFKCHGEINSLMMGNRNHVEWTIWFFSCWIFTSKIKYRWTKISTADLLPSRLYCSLKPKTLSIIKLILWYFNQDGREVLRGTNQRMLSNRYWIVSQLLWIAQCNNSLLLSGCKVI